MEIVAVRNRRCLFTATLSIYGVDTLLPTYRCHEKKFTYFVTRRQSLPGMVFTRITRVLPEIVTSRERLSVIYIRVIKPVLRIH